MVAMYLSEQSYYSQGSGCEADGYALSHEAVFIEKISWWPSFSCESWYEWLLILLCLDLKATYFW